jgi:Flp pilus assembly pilin Flp
LKRIAIFRDARAAVTRLPARADRERGQSLTEYALILAVIVAASTAVLGVVSPPVFGQLDLVTAALQGEGEESASGGSFPLPAWIAIAALVIGAVGVYLVKMRRG